MAEKAIIKNLATNEEIPVMFNPANYSVITSADVSGEGANLQFKKVKIEDFTVSLFYDTYEKGDDVRNETGKITALLSPTVEGKTTKQPPVCAFVWGKFNYKGIIYKIDQKFTMFLATGVPVRSELTVTFKSVVTTDEDAALKGKEACRKLWTVKDGDRLDLIAHVALNDAAQWRKVAYANNIADPLVFPSADDIGRVLVIPD